jgi:hypothetical protein
MEFISSLTFLAEGSYGEGSPIKKITSRASSGGKAARAGARKITRRGLAAS